MELAHLVNPSHWEVSGNSRCMDLLTWFCNYIVISHYATITVTYIAFFICAGAPQLLVTTPVNSTTVNVSWSAVQCFNGSEAVTHYLVQYWSICGGAVKNVTTGGLSLV